MCLSCCLFVASQIHRPLRLNLDAAEEVDVFVGTLLSDSSNRSQLSRRSRSRSQSVSDFGRICDSYMVTGDECSCSNDEKSILRQCRSRTTNTNMKGPSSCLESSEGVEEPINSSLKERVEPFNDRIQTSSILKDGYSGPIYCSGPNRSDQILGPSVDVSDGFIVNKMSGKKHSRSRLRRFAASFDSGRERIYTGECDFGQREIKEKSEATKGDLTGRRIYVKTNSVDGSNHINTTRADSFRESNNEGEPPQIGDREVRKKRSILDTAHSFYNGGQKVCLERIGVRIGLELSSPVGSKSPFGVTDAKFTVSVSKSSEEKDDGKSDVHQLRNSWELNSEMNIFEKSGETSDELELESHQRKGMEKDLLPKSGTVLGQHLNKEQSPNAQELQKNGFVVVNPVRKIFIDESNKETQPSRNEIRMKEPDVDVNDPVIDEDNVMPEDVTCSHSDNSQTAVHSETIKHPIDPVLIDNSNTLTDIGCTDNPSDIKTMECENIKADYYGTKNSDSMPTHQLARETFDLLRSTQLKDSVKPDEEMYQVSDVDSLFSEKTSEHQRFVSFKPQLSAAMKNRLQELSVMYSESDSEDWYPSSVKKTEPIDGIRKGSLKGTLICDMAKLSEFLCSSNDSGVQTPQKDDQVKKATKIPSQASSRKTHTLSSASEARSTLPRISSSSTTPRRNTAASNTTPSTTQVSSSSSSTKRVAKPVMPRSLPIKATDLTATKAKAEQKKNPQRPTCDLKDASSVGALKRVTSVASPLTQRKEVEKPGQTSVFTRLAAPKTSVVKKPSLVGVSSLDLYIRTPATHKSLKVEECKSLYLKPSPSGSAISRVGKTLEQPCSVANRQHTRIPSANKESSLNLLDSKSTEKPLSSVVQPKVTMSRVFASGSSKQLMLRRKSMDSNSSSDLLHAFSSKNISRKTQSKDTKDHKAVGSKRGLQQSLTHFKPSEDHKFTAQGQTGLLQSNCAEDKQRKVIDNQQFTAEHQLGISQSHTSEYEQQCLSTHSEITENEQEQNHPEQLRTAETIHRQGQKTDTSKDENRGNTECPPISKPTAKVAPLKISNTPASGLPRKSSAKSTSRQTIRQT